MKVGARLAVFTLLLGAAPVAADGVAWPQMAQYPPGAYIFEATGQLVGRSGACIYIRADNGVVYGALNAQSQFADTPAGVRFRFRASYSTQQVCPSAVTIVNVAIAGAPPQPQNNLGSFVMTGRLAGRNGTCIYIRGDNGYLYGAINAQSQFADTPPGMRFRFSATVLARSFCPGAITIINVRNLGGA